MDVCEACRRSLAEFLCLCSSPFLRICSTCVNEHIKKTSKSHSLEPIACRDFLRSQDDIPLYRARQQTISLTESALDSNLTRFDSFKHSLQLLLPTITTWISSKTAELDRIEPGIREIVRECREKCRELMKEPSPRVECKLTDVVVRNERDLDREMMVFQGKVPNTETINSVLEGLFQYKVEKSPLKVGITAPKPSLIEEIKTGNGRNEGNTEELRRKLERLELATARNEGKIDEKNEKIAKLERELQKAQAERDKAQRELEDAKRMLVTAKELLEQKMNAQRSTDTGTPQEIHAKVTCDGCGQYPLQGPRWQCQSCPNFDFCQQCFDSTPHPASHRFQRKSPSESLIS